MSARRLPLQGRIYRVAELFRLLEYNMSVSLLVTTLVRNFSVGGRPRPPGRRCCHSSCPVPLPHSQPWHARTRRTGACSAVACCHPPQHSAADERGPRSPAQFAFLVVHMAACLLYYIARQSNFDERHTWVGAAAGLMEDKNTVERWAAGGELSCWLLPSLQRACLQLAAMCHGLQTAGCGAAYLLCRYMYSVYYATTTFGAPLTLHPNP